MKVRKEIDFGEGIAAEQWGCGIRIKQTGHYATHYPKDDVIYLTREQVRVIYRELAEEES